MDSLEKPYILSSASFFFPRHLPFAFRIPHTLRDTPLVSITRTCKRVSGGWQHARVCLVPSIASRWTVPECYWTFFASCLLPNTGCHGSTKRNTVQIEIRRSSPRMAGSCTLRQSSIPALPKSRSHTAPLEQRASPHQTAVSAYWILLSSIHIYSCPTTANRSLHGSGVFSI